MLVHKFHAGSFGGSSSIPGRAKQPPRCSSCAQERPEAAVPLAPRTLRYLTRVSAPLASPMGGHTLLFSSTHTLPRMSLHVVRSFSSSLTKPSREIHLLQAGEPDSLVPGVRCVREIKSKLCLNLQYPHSHKMTKP